MCDMGCSAGILTMLFAELFPKSQVYGLDIGEHAIELAKQVSAEKSLTNCHFCVADICNLSSEWKNKFDYIFMFDVLHDLPSVSEALENIKGALKSGAYFSVVDFGLHKNLEDNMTNPLAPLLYGAGLLHCIPVSLYEDNATDGGYGPAWGKETAVDCLQKAGFVEPEVVHEEGLQAFFLTRKQ